MANNPVSMSAAPAHQQPKGEFPSRAHQFPPGVSGNPAGRPAAGAVVREWYNAMASYSPEDLRAVMADPAAPAAKLAAARVWLDAISSDRNAVNVPIAGAEIDRICDRTDGKPTQRIEAQVETPAAVQIVTPLTAAANDPANPAG